MCDIIYPVFEKCKKYTFDPFWKILLEDTARGKFHKSMESFDPKTFTITFIYYIVKKKQRLIKKAEKKNCLFLFKSCKDGFNKVGIFSPNELPITTGPIFHYTKWNHIKTKALKEEMISKYVSRKYPKNPEKFFEIISLIQTKHITPTNIKIVNGKIDNIEIKPLPTTNKSVNFPKYEYIKKTDLLSSAVEKFTKERSKRFL